jgi:hypothetical protein
LLSRSGDAATAVVARLAHLDRYHRLRDGHEDARSDANSDGSGTRCGQSLLSRSGDAATAVVVVVVGVGVIALE